MNDYQPTQSDHALEAFLASVSREQVWCDLAPTTELEIRMLGRHVGNAA